VLSGVSIQRNVRNAVNATDGKDATTSEAASNLFFDTPSFVTNIKLLGVCFYSVNCGYFVYLFYS